MASKPKQPAGPPMTLGNMRSSSPVRGAMAELLRRSAAIVATLIAGLCSKESELHEAHR
jgi:hypothetical protein